MFVIGNPYVRHLRLQLAAPLKRLRKESLLHLILGGAAVHRCDNRTILHKALAAEGVPSAQKRLFPQAVKPSPFESDSN
jgi:hypothetical protein